jgi:tetratricopeptide (TPR) repeat protein
MLKITTFQEYHRSVRRTLRIVRLRGHDRMDVMMDRAALHHDAPHKLRPASTGDFRQLDRRITSIIAVCVLLVIAPHRSSCAQAPADQELTAGVAAEKAGHYEEAAAHYQKALSAYPASPLSHSTIEIRTRLATALFMLHSYDDSLQALAPLPFQHAGDSSVPSQAWVVRGLDQLDLNRLAEAIRSLRRALDLNPDSGTARLALGDALVRSGRGEEGSDAYRAQLERTPEVAEAWYKLGLLYDDLAGKLTTDLDARKASDGPAAELAAERLSEHGDYWGAAQILLPFAAEWPDTSKPASSKTEGRTIEPGLRAQFGEILLQINYPHAAENQFRTELAQDPASFPALFGMMQLAVLQSNWDSALHDFRRLTTLYPKELSRRLELPPAAALSDGWKQNHITMPEAVAASPDGKLLASWLGSAGLEQPTATSESQAMCSVPPSASQREPGHWLSEACAARLAQELRSQKGLTSAGEIKLAEIDYRLGDYEAARQAAIELRRGSPQNSRADYWLAKCYSALAGQCFQKLAELNPDSVRVHQLLARRDSDRQELTAAQREYEAALRLSPDLPDLHLGLGTIFWQIGNWKSAEDELAQTLRLSPESTVAAYELGDSYVQQHQWQQASEYLRPALKDPNVTRGARLDFAKAEAALGQRDAAIQDLLQLADGDRDGEVHYRLAALYRESGEKAKARQAQATSEALRKASDQLSREKIEALEGEKRSLQQVNDPSPR